MSCSPPIPRSRPSGSLLAFAFLLARLLAHHLSMTSFGIGGGVSLGMGMIFTSSGTSLSLLDSASLKSLRRFPKTPLSLSLPSRGGPPRLNWGAASPRDSRAFCTAFNSFSRPSSTCSSCRVSLPPPLATAFRSSICFCMCTGFRFARRSLRLAATSALPVPRVNDGDAEWASRARYLF